QEEILRTLDHRGRLDGMPFMAEMLQYCGRRFQVFKRADKTCDNIQRWSIRRVRDSVHLQGLRCDGSVQGRWEAGCLVFWKEAWLKRADAGLTVLNGAARPVSARNGAQPISGCRSVSQLVELGQTESASGEPVYNCQATELLNFTSPLPWWD